MPNNRTNNSHRQSGNSSRHGVKHLAHEVGITPRQMRKWLRRALGCRGHLWIFNEREARRIIAEYRKSPWETRR